MLSKYLLLFFFFFLPTFVYSQQFVAVPEGATDEELIQAAISVKPSDRQMAWQEMEYYGFIHFGINTFTGQEWSDGTNSPRLFNPTELDAGQWVKTFKNAGMKGLILTAKHHDGFCLWPSRTTNYSVKQSPWRNGNGDLVREVADACRREGIKIGIYISPWDRNHPTYGDSPAYNKVFMNQLTELLTNYGELFEVWFDGANGEGPNGKVQQYDWESYYTLIRRLQPNAVIAVMGPDVRWVGNEAGKGRDPEWSVLPIGVASQKSIAGDSQQEVSNGMFIP
ncbi:MAG: alpha-L-fucosidase, partial [Paludibacter sp.]|nr:alpha-L-fucosidase [Paludibacter sp.]